MPQYTTDAEGDKALPRALPSPKFSTPLEQGGPPCAGATPFDRATASLDAPLAVVDLQAFDANATDLVRRSKGKPIRVASKSVRCRALLERVLARDGFAGIMSFTLAESLWLARSGFPDVLLAYPSADRAGFAELTAGPQLAAAVTVMIDDPVQLDLIDAARQAAWGG